MDEEILTLAREKKAMVFSNDRELRKRAQAEGLAAFNLADFLFLLLCQEVPDLKEYQGLIWALQRAGLISRELMAQYLNLNV